MQQGQRPYGEGDASFQAAGGEAGIRRLVDDFYRIMDELPEAATIRAMYPQSLDQARDRLASFLCGWLGGPRRYSEKYGSISVPRFHTQWQIGPAESAAWLCCMELAIARQPYAPEFADYLLTQLRVPASRIVDACRKLRPGSL